MAALAQTQAGSDAAAGAGADQPAALAAPGPVDLNWVPPAMAELTSQAAVKSSFTLDRRLLGIAAGLVPDAQTEVRQAVDKLDGLSVRVLGFGDAAAMNEAQVDAVRAGYHQRGWKHVATTTGSGGPLKNGTTDVWLALDGANLRGAAILVEGAKSLTLVTVAGNLSPLDLLHLRGHFGIPRFAADGLKNSMEQ